MSAPVSRDTALAIERVEAAAWQDAHMAATNDDVRALGLRTALVAGACVMSADRVESLLMNRVLGLGLHEHASEAAVDALLAHFRNHPEGFGVNLSPFAQPPGIEHWLQARGFATFFRHVKWVRGHEPAPAPASAFRIVRATPGEAGDWAALSVRVFEHSPAQARWLARTIGREGWSHYFAYDGAQRVAKAALFVHERAAWLGSAGTLVSHRRQGAQSALLAQRITDALAAGAEWLTLETAPEMPHLPGTSLRNAARAGFHPAYERPSWIWPVP